MIRLVGLFMGACALCMMLVGCGASSTTKQSQTVDNVTIALEAPAAPKLLEQAGFTITLSDAAGKPVDGADVYLDMEMSTMPMGTNKPVATASGNGTYHAQGTFDMTGKWDITVHATVEGKDHAAMFTSDVTPK